MSPTYDGRVTYAEDDDGRGICPYCAAHGQITETDDPREKDSPRYMEIDTGSTKPLAGILCDECDREVGR